MLDKIPVDELPRTSKQTKQRLSKIGLKNYYDLINYYPVRYEDYSMISKIGSVQNGEKVTIKGTLKSIKTQYLNKGLKIQKGVLTDETGSIELVWFNQPYLSSYLVPDSIISVSGIVEFFGKKAQIKPLEYEVLETLTSDTKHTGKIVPVYSQIYGLSSKTIRDKIHFVLNQEVFFDADLEYLPDDFSISNDLIGLTQALSQIHFPANTALLQKARKRLQFDELFIIMLSSKIIRNRWKKESVTNKFKLFEHKVSLFIKSLPFELTPDQKTSVSEISTDLAKATPMNRFLQGDVGSGKTVVSAIAVYIAYLNKYRSMYMAPTEILAQQHFATFQKLFKKSGLKVGLQTGSVKSVTKKNKNDFDLIVGTQALISKSIDIPKVGLVIIDEQHRFGVKQRGELRIKGENPHFLSMTATPIPRTVSLTLYNELDMSVIATQPKGRLPIKTFVVPDHKRKNCYEWIGKQIGTHKTQCFVICSLIEASESETMASVKAAKDEFECLKTKIFPDLDVALIHGKMKSVEKEKIMSDFNKNKIQILVSTSVVEVGIDVPNATIMIIEGAERFGLAQLHQLRGRIGRGAKQSYCYLFTSDKNSKNDGRLNFFARTYSGMKLAEFDLKIRGPGEFYSSKQHGYSDLKLADLTDYKFVDFVNKASLEFLKKYNLEKYPLLQARLQKYGVKSINRD